MNILRRQPQRITLFRPHSLHLFPSTFLFFTHFLIPFVHSLSYFSLLLPILYNYTISTPFLSLKYLFLYISHISVSLLPFLIFVFFCHSLYF